MGKEESEEGTEGDAGSRGDVSAKEEGKYKREMESSNGKTLLPKWGGCEKWGTGSQDL